MTFRGLEGEGEGHGVEDDLRLPGFITVCKHVISLLHIPKGAPSRLCVVAPLSWTTFCDMMSACVNKCRVPYLKSRSSHTDYP